MFWIILGVVLFTTLTYISAQYSDCDDVEFTIGLFSLLLLCGLLSLFGVDESIGDREYTVVETQDYQMVESIDDLNFNKAYHHIVTGLYVERERIPTFDAILTEGESYVLKEVRDYHKTLFKFGFTRTAYIYFCNEED